MEQPTQAEALRLAEALDHSTSPWNGERVMFAEAAAELRRLHAELESLRGSQQAERAVPAEPTQAMISAMLASKARDDEGEFPALMDLIDYRGENKNHAVIRAAYAAMLAAAPVQQAAPAGDAEDTARLNWLDQQCEAYGFEDIHEGNRWAIYGAYADLRKAIDAIRAAIASQQP